MNKTLIVTDALFVITVVVIAYNNDGFDGNPLFLNILVGVAFASCIIRHINYYKQTKRIY
ncbi:MAG: hypothetical protein M3O71_11870 [Bacteroidota bacterium]|nr:hypothetical protein [Bacteroidota bacterium]